MANMIECMDCDGSGEEECPHCWDGTTPCSNCGGEGTIQEYEEDTPEECPDCYGEGDEVCAWCDGHGTQVCRECEGSGEIESWEE